jgi:TolB protein
VRSIILLLASGLLITACNSTIEKPIQYSIAYNVYAPDSTSPDNYEIFITDLNGSSKKNLTNHKDVAWTYYTFQDKIFFISDRDTAYRNFFLYQMDADGNNIKRVSDLRLEDSWMSSRNNGMELVVTGRIGKEIRYQLFIVNVKTGEFQQITNDTAAYHSDPCFSPDGEQIVFAYQKNKRDKSAHEELFIMNADGTGMKQITYYPEDNVSAHDHGYKAGAPKWHPTDKFITYISKQNNRYNIYAATPDGNKQWKLTKNTANEGWHDWSSDGEWLVYDSANDSGSQYHIMLMNWKTKELKQITDTTYKYQQAPVFVEN